MDNAFAYTVTNHGLCGEANFSYDAHCGICQRKAAISFIVSLPSGDSDSLKAAVSSQPVSDAIAVIDQAFQFYKSGIYRVDHSIQASDLNHGIAIIGGYDSESWLVRSTWGENGYARIAFKNSRIDLQASYPIAA